MSNLKPGTRIRLISMDDDPDPIEPGTLGTVKSVEVIDPREWTQVDVAWDNGRTLMLSLPADKYAVVSEPTNAPE